MMFEIYKISIYLKPWVEEIVLAWGADFIVSRGRKIYPSDIEGYFAVDENQNKVGLITFEIIGRQCEVVTLDAFKKFSGIGTALLEKVFTIAKERGCSRVWLITINDNLDAIRFYHKRGMTISAVYLNALEQSRKLKHRIPHIGNFGIPMRDEIEFEKLLT